MARADHNDPGEGPSCERCGAALAEGRWARLAADYRGRLPDHFRPAEKRVCLDCVAALGLLEAADGPRGEPGESNGTSRLARLRFR